MVRGLYTATTGMLHQQQRMDIISNNLANVNTTGFKKDGVISESFENILALKINDNREHYMNRPIGNMSLGVRTGEVFTDYEQGSFEQTTSPFHLALQGSGFFTIEDRETNGLFYTRDGSFSLSVDGFLITTEGDYVLGNNGRISLPNQDIAVDSSGQIYSNDNLVDTIRIRNFANSENLEKLGDNLYRIDEDAEELPFTGTILQGYLENSNVNTIREMVAMISVTRAYETSQKIVQMQDEGLSKVVNEIGRV